MKSYNLMVVFYCLLLSASKSTIVVLLLPSIFLESNLRPLEGFLMHHFKSRWLFAYPSFNLLDSLPYVSNFSHIRLKTLPKLESYLPLFRAHPGTATCMNDLLLGCSLRASVHAGSVNSNTGIQHHERKRNESKQGFLQTSLHCGRKR